jgi:hypothetical protein
VQVAGGSLVGFLGSVVLNYGGGGMYWLCSDDGG